MTSHEKYEKIKQIAEKFGFDDIVEQCNDILIQEKINVCFLGQFSTGKTSLINALLGLDLPVSRRPTTKKVCQIESCDTQVDRVKYWKESNSGVRVSIPEEAMQVLLDEGDTNVKVIVTIPKSPLLENCIFFDTPGFNNNIRDDNVTLGEVALMDLFVYCISGNIDENDMAVLCNPLIQRAETNVLIVSTKADGEEDTAIMANNLTRISKLPGFNATSLEKRSFMTSTKNDESSVSRFGKALHARICALHDDILEKRRMWRYEEIERTLSKRLADARDLLSFDDTQLNIRERDCRLEIDKCHRLKIEARVFFDKSKDKLGKRLKNIFSNYKLSFMGAANSQERTEVLKKAFEEASASVSSFFREEFKSVDEKDFADLANLNTLFADLNTEANVSEKVGDLFTIIATAALAAYAGPLEGAGNALEMVLGNIMFGKCEGQIFGALRKLNPIAYISDIGVELFKSGRFDEYCNKADRIGRRIVDSTYDVFDRFYLQPQEHRIQAEIGEIETLRQLRSRGLIELKERKDAMLKAIDELECAPV